MERQQRHLAPSLRCHQCSMVFSTISQLSMHREKFCVGRIMQQKYDPYPVTNNNEQKIAEERIKQLKILKENNMRRNDEKNERDRLLISQSQVRDSEPDFAESQLRHQLQRQVNNLSNVHDKNLTDLQAHGANLRKSRQEIENKITELKQDSFKRQQDMENEKFRISSVRDDRAVIEDLKNQIQSLHTSRSYPPNSELQPSPQHPTITTQSVYAAQPGMPAQPGFPAQAGIPDQHPFGVPAFNFTGGPLASEISALRQHYLSTGGRDPLIVQQLTDMHNEAQLLDASPRQQPTRLTTGAPHSSEQLAAMEMENYRLQRELMLLDNGRISKSSQSAVNLNGRLQQLNDNHTARIMALEREMELTRHQALLDAMKECVRPQPSQPPLSYYKPVADTPSNSYDPSKGFVIFYDFVMGLDPSIYNCKLVVGIYNKVVELGEPSFLPTVHTELTPGGTTAMIGARQPVPQCSPSSDLCLVVELQASDSTPENLRTKAWLKFDLFNIGNALQAGAWRVPFRLPPIKPEISSSSLLSHPLYADASLYLRVVNHSDSHRHSEAVISSANSVDYKTPHVSQVSSGEQTAASMWS